MGTDFGPGSMTDSGYPRIIKEWKRATPLAEAALVMEGQPKDMGVYAMRDLTPGFERESCSGGRPSGHQRYFCAARKAEQDREA